MNEHKTNKEKNNKLNNLINKVKNGISVINTRNKFNNLIKGIKKEISAISTHNKLKEFVENNSEYLKYTFLEILKIEQKAKQERKSVNKLSILIDELIDKEIERYINSEENETDFIKFVELDQSLAVKYFCKLEEIEGKMEKEINVTKEEKEKIKTKKNRIADAKNRISSIALEQFKVELKNKKDIGILIKDGYDKVIANTEDNFKFENSNSSLEAIVEIIRLNRKISENKNNKGENINKLISIINKFLEEKGCNDFNKYTNIVTFIGQHLTNFKHLFLDKNGQIDFNSIESFKKGVEFSNDYKNYFNNFIYSKIEEDVLKKKNKSTRNNSTENCFNDIFSENLSHEDKILLMFHMLKTIVIGTNKTNRENFKKSNKDVGYALIEDDAFGKFVELFNNFKNFKEVEDVFKQYAEFSGYNLSQFSAVFVELFVYCNNNKLDSVEENIFKMLSDIFKDDMKINKNFEGNRNYEKYFNDSYKYLLYNISLQVFLTEKIEISNKIKQFCEKKIIEVGENLINNLEKNKNKEVNKVIVDNIKLYLKFLNKQGELEKKKKDILERISKGNTGTYQTVQNEIESIENKNKEKQNDEQIQILKSNEKKEQIGDEIKLEKDKKIIDSFGGTNTIIYFSQKNIPQNNTEEKKEKIKGVVLKDKTNKDQQLNNGRQTILQGSEEESIKILEDKGKSFIKNGCGYKFAERFNGYHFNFKLKDKNGNTNVYVCDYNLKNKKNPITISERGKKTFNGASKRINSRLLEYNSQQKIKIDEEKLLKALTSEIKGKLKESQSKKESLIKLKKMESLIKFFEVYTERNNDIGKCGK